MQDLEKLVRIIQQVPQMERPVNLVKLLAKTNGRFIATNRGVFFITPMGKILRVNALEIATKLETDYVLPDQWERDVLGVTSINDLNIDSLFNLNEVDPKRATEAFEYSGIDIAKENARVFHYLIDEITYQVLRFKNGKEPFDFCFGTCAPESTIVYGQYVQAEKKETWPDMYRRLFDILV